MTPSFTFKVDTRELAGKTWKAMPDSLPLATLTRRSMPSLEMTYTDRGPNIGLGRGT